MDGRWLTASSLGKNIGTEVADNVVRDVIDQIDENILMANSAGMCHVEFELPADLSINNMPPKHAQALVYSELIEAYRTSESEGGKGFDRTYIIHKDDRTWLRVEWTNMMDAASYEARKEIIKNAKYPGPPAKRD